MLITLAIIVVIIAMNIFASREVRRGIDPGYRQNMLVAIIWMVPVFGCLMAYSHTPREAREHAANTRLPGTVDDAVQDALQLAGLAPFNLAEHVHDVNGFPMMDWQALHQWVEGATVPAEADMAWAAGTRAWLIRMREVCGPSFRLLETEDAYILSSLDDSVLLATAAYISSTRKRIGAVLQGVAAFPAGVKSILLVLPDEDAYYQYLSNQHSDEGEFAYSSGVFINAGCPHFVVTVADLSTIEPVIAHEMTHSALAYLELPRWLDEGLAVNTEHRLTVVPKLIYTPHEMHAKHLKYWSAAQVQQFWSGESFFRHDDGNLLSYELARILVSHLSGDWGRFKDFVCHANRDDGGARAAQDYLGVELGVLVCALLEQAYSPDWEPAGQSGERPA